MTLRREKFSGPVELSDSDEDPAMAPTVEGRLLFDAPAFQAELAKLEPTCKVDRPTLTEWAEEQGLALSPPAAVPSPPDSVPASRSHRHGRAGRAMSAITFVMLMAAGAGVAAIVFYDRVLRIITTW